MPPRNVDVCLEPAKNGFSESVNDAASASEVTPVHTAPVKQPPLQIVWRNVAVFVVLHAAALYGMYLIFYAKPYTLLWAFLMYNLSALGITAGAHRLWAHKTYTARLPLGIFLAICNSSAIQNDIIEWSRDHRTHHKYSETDADPHNANRGFFFSHVGWLLCRKHPEVRNKGKNLDISDLLNDPVCKIQRKFYVESCLLFCFVIPTVIPWYYWGESAVVAFFVAAVFRYVAVLNVTWTVNSIAHSWGNKPYDQRINPVENAIVALFSNGEGFHNYHHAFPMDYRTSEYQWKLNVTTAFINFMAFIGQAYNLKTASTSVVQQRQDKWGDGTTGFGSFASSLGLHTSRGVCQEHLIKQE